MNDNTFRYAKYSNKAREIRTVLHLHQTIEKTKDHCTESIVPIIMFTRCFKLR